MRLFHFCDSVSGNIAKLAPGSLDTLEFGLFLKHIFLRPEILSRLIFETSEGGKYYVRATLSQKARRALPEEIIRQLFVLSLIHDYRYPEELINLEWPIQVGREKKRADIVIMNDDGEPSIIIEVKISIDENAIGQLRSYMALTGTHYGAIVSATEMSCLKMETPRNVHSIKDIPTFVADGRATTQVENPRTTRSVLPNTEPNDDEVPASLPESISQYDLTDEVPINLPIAIEHFEWADQKHVRITIEGHTLRLPYAEMDSYKKVRKKFFAEGVALDPRIKEAQWNDLLYQLLKSNPRPSISTSPNKILGRAEQEVIDAINQNREGFRNGWVSSIALDALLKERDCESMAPRSKRTELMKRLGYVHHPSLYGGRATRPIATGERPVLYIKEGHPNGDIEDGMSITQAYEDAQTN